MLHHVNTSMLEILSITNFELFELGDHRVTL